MKITHDETILWQQRIDAWRESGLKQSVWCRQYSIQASKVWYWKKKLSLLTEKELQPKRKDSKLLEAEQSAFVSVAVTPTVSTLQASEGLSIELPNGVKVSGVLASNVAVAKTLIEALI